MPRRFLSGTVSTPKVDVVIDMGNPLLNVTVDGLLKVGTVAATRALAEDTYHILKKGSLSGHDVEHTLQKMCKEGAYWGTVGGVYAGLEYGVEQIRGRRDWKNAMIGGGLTGLVISAASNNRRDKVVMDTITGAAVATAADLLTYWA